MINLSIDLLIFKTLLLFSKTPKGLILKMIFLLCLDWKVCIINLPKPDVYKVTPLAVEPVETRLHALGDPLYLKLKHWRLDISHDVFEVAYELITCIDN